jgi:hypothetical protein
VTIVWFGYWAEGSPYQLRFGAVLGAINAIAGPSGVAGKLQRRRLIEGEMARAGRIMNHADVARAMADGGIEGGGCRNPADFDVYGHGLNAVIPA